MAGIIALLVRRIFVIGNQFQRVQPVLPEFHLDHGRFGSNHRLINVRALHRIGDERRRREGRVEIKGQDRIGRLHQGAVFPDLNDGTGGQFVHNIVSINEVVFDVSPKTTCQHAREHESGGQSGGDEKAHTIR